jgi:hypothetical protein
VIRLTSTPDTDRVEYERCIMSGWTLDRHGGSVTATAGALVIASQVTTVIALLVTDGDDVVDSVQQPIVLISTLLTLTTFCVVALALVALYLYYLDALGWFGTAAFVFGLVGTILLTGDFWYEAFVVPWLADVAPNVVDIQPTGRLFVGASVTFAFFAVGWVMFGIALLRTRRLPRSACALLIVGGLLGYLAANPPFGVVLGIALLWLGIAQARSSKAHPDPPMHSVEAHRRAV